MLSSIGHNNLPLLALAILGLLDLSAAFDTVDHAILLKRLHTSFGICGSALKWFCSYLSYRRQYVRCGGACSDIVDVVCGVPHGSVLGSILFIHYTADLYLLLSLLTGCQLTCMLMI